MPDVWHSSAIEPVHTVMFDRNSRVGHLPCVSVIVPVWNDADRLARCLSSLTQQGYPSDKMQIIVVDNGSKDHSRHVALSCSRVRLLDEPQCGSYAARNRGLREARGDYVAFIDSDCEASSDWLERAVAAAGAIDDSGNDIGIVVGRIELRLGTMPRSGSILYEQIFAFDQKANAAQGLGVTANWFSPLAVMRKFGGFDDTLMSGADTKLASQIAAAGYRVVYADDALVYHEARDTIATLSAKRRRLVGGRWAGHDGKGVPRTSLFLTLSKRFVGEARFAARSPDLYWVGKLKVVCVIAALWAVSMGELTRLCLGGRTRRS